MDELQEACVALAEAWNKAMVSFEKNDKGAKRSIRTNYAGRGNL